MPTEDCGMSPSNVLLWYPVDTVVVVEILINNEERQGQFTNEDLYFIQNVLKTSIAIMKLVDEPPLDDLFRAPTNTFL